MRITRDFTPVDRYLYDFKVCTMDKGWAQIDTDQDASYYGNWINPEKLLIFCYCEGDTTLTTCDTPEELVSEVQKMKQWNQEQGHRFMGIDPGFSEPLKSKLIQSGLGEYLH